MRAIFVLFDSLMRTALGCYGSTGIRTPNFDRFAQKGVATVPVAIARFAQQYGTQHGQMAAAAVIATIPALLLMALGQRFIVRGLTMGSVK